MAGLEPGGNQFFPDLRQLAQGGAEQVHPLAAGDLGVQVVFLGHFTQHDEFVRRDLTTRDTRHDGIGAVLLHVGHEGVVGVLQRYVIRGQNVLVPAGGQDRRHRRFADIAAMALAVLTDQSAEGANAIHLHNVEQLLAAVREVLAQILAHFYTAFFQLAVHHVLQERCTTAAACTGLGFGLDAAKV